METTTHNEPVTERRRQLFALRDHYDIASAELNRLRPKLSVPNFPDVATIGDLDTADFERLVDYWARLIGEFEGLAREPHQELARPDRPRHQAHENLVHEIAVAAPLRKRDLLGEI